MTVEAGRYTGRLAWPVAAMATVAAAAGLGAFSAMSPVILVALIAVVAGVVLARQLRPAPALPHLLVLSMFLESTTVGSVRIGRLLAVVVVLAIVAQFATQGRPALKPPARAVVLPAFAFLCWSFASGFWAGSVRAWLGTIGALGLAAAYFLGFALLVRGGAEVRALLRSYVLAALAASVLALFQAGAGIRALGVQGDPNLFALYQVAALPATMMLARTATTRWARARWLSVLLPVGGSIVASGSRGGLLATAAVVMVSVLRGDAGILRRNNRALAAVVAALVLSVLASTAVTVDPRFSPSRVTQDRASGRLDIWHVAESAWRRHPVLGLGGGNFQAQSQRLLETTPGVRLDPNSILIRTGIRVHNVYLETLTEYGPLGLLLWVAVLVSTAVRLRAAERHAPNPAAYSSLFAMLVGFATATVFLSVTNSKLLWMIVGLAAGAAGGVPSADRVAAPATTPAVTGTR